VSSPQDDKPHLPAPSLWPLGFAAGIACLLVGLVVSELVAVVGGALTLIFGFLWIRDVTSAVSAPPAHVEPESRRAAAAAPAPAGADDELVSAEEETAYSRSTFLSATTLGLGAVIGGAITVPVLGFAVLPSFTNQPDQNVELGPLEDFPEGRFVIATYLEQPEVGEVSRRTVFVRNNGFLEDQPSFTILFSRCVHLGCPVQPNGLIDEDTRKTVGEHDVVLTQTSPSGFGCPCHGGQYDTEGNRTAGPPVRAMDRAQFSIRNGSLWLGSFYSVSEVEGTGAEARIMKYGRASPGVHVDGISSWLYPIEVP
jgi:Rieske Fe-S protein